MRRPSPLALAIVCSALWLYGCGDDGEKAKSEPGVEVPQRKVLETPRLQAHKNLDPIMQFDESSADIVGNVYDSLLDYHYLKRPYELAPNLLTKMPELSADKLTYSFELRNDVRFIDDPCFPGGKGRALNADDVIYSIKRFADANLNSRSYLFLAGAIEGMDEFRAQTKTAGRGADYSKLQISGIKKIDDRHFTIRLTRENPLALYPFAATQLSIVPREAVEHYKDQFEHHPVGSGPFKIKDYARRGVMVLVKNENYHLTYPKEGAPGDAEAGLLRDAGKRLPLVDEVRLPLIEEAQPAMLKFLRGQLDWVGMDKDNFVKMAEKDAKGFHLKPEYAGKFVLYSEPSLSAEYFKFNMKDPLLGKNKALRQAFAYAFDAQAYIDQMRNGRGYVLQSIVPLPIAGSERDTHVTWYPYDPEKAKAKLIEAGYAGGKGLPPITIEYRASNTDMRQVHEFFRAQLAAVGITLEPSYQSFSTFIQKEESGNFQLSSNGWQADYPDAENFFQLLYSKNTPPGPNSGSYNNPEYDRLYEQSRFMPNGPARFALFKQMSELIKNDVPLIIRWTPTVVGLHQKWLGNFKRNIMDGKPFEYFNIDAAEKARGID